MGGDDGKVGEIDERRVSEHISCRILSQVKLRVQELADMTSIGLGLPRDTFREAGRYG